MLARSSFARNFVACIATVQLIYFLHVVPTSHGLALLPILAPQISLTTHLSLNYPPKPPPQQIGLFFYDIFWVFGTDVMVSVATKFDAPIKLLFPRALATEDTSSVLQMLGLGDIVMPGLFISMLLRYDFYKATKTVLVSDKSKRRSQELNLRRTLKFSKPYFNMCILLYTLGLVTTVWVMHTFKHAQPALLYLVPACISAVFLAGAIKGDLFEALAFEEEPAESEEKEK